MSVNFQSCIRSICNRTKCSVNEAWEGLNTAFLSLDQSMPEPAQYWWLIRIGSFNVVDAVRQQYTGTDGVRRFEPSDFQTTPAPDSADHEWDFLNAFPEGLTREFAQRLAEGSSKFTVDSAKHWLRTQYHINNRTTSRSIINEIRVCAKRL